MTIHQQDKIPLILGITGHRNLRPNELEQIGERIREVIRLLRTEYPHTPLMLLSPLAEGADRLAAQVAQKENIKVIVPFPLPKSEYCRDFKTQESLNEFNVLLEKADWFELPVLNQGIEEKKSPARFAQYALVGAYVARHSHILIALWDGRQLPNPGSTYEVIQFRLTGTMQSLPDAYKPPINPLDFVDTGKVYHIKVSRDNDAKPFIDAGEVHILAPEQREPSTDMRLLLSEQFRQIDIFNQDVTEYIKQHGEIAYSKGELVPKHIFQRLSEPFKKMARIHELAGFLSVENRRPTEKAIRAIFIIGVLMVLAIEFYAHPPWLHSGEYPNWLLGVYFGLFALGYGIFRWANQKRIHDKYLHYRTLAEALRVQMFWQLGGLHESVADFYQRKHRNELEWIRSSVRALCTHNWVNDQQGVDVVRDYWIQKQAKYFTKRTRSSHTKLTRIERLAQILFVSGLGLAAVLFGWGWFAVDSVHHHHPLHSTLIILMVFLPAVGAALDGYAEKSGFDAHFKRYQEMAIIFQRAKQELEKPSVDGSHQRILLELGKVALEENSDWLLLHRDRPVALPKG